MKQNINLLFESAPVSLLLVYLCQSRLGQFHKETNEYS